MTLECINPDDLPTPKTYTQVVVATGSKLVFISGQEPEDIDGSSSAMVAHAAVAVSRPRASPTRPAPGSRVGLG